MDLCIEVYGSIGKIAVYGTEEDIRSSCKTGRCSFLSSEEQEKYDESIKAIDDYYSGLYGSYVDGEEKGRAKVARNLLAMGMSWSQIIQATGLTEEQLKQLQS